MRITVASGKGGTGKTTVATSLALVAGENVRFMDCDVEAPNAALFLKPIFDIRQDVGILIPVVEESLCTYCAKCAEVCEFHAIAVIGRKTLVFPELCHGCGSCTLICPEHAIHESINTMGIIESGRTSTGINFTQGVMNIGEPMAVPIIRQLKKRVPGDPTFIDILDAAPGAACPVVETIRQSDFALLVTEPTPFGLHDLKQVLGIVRTLGIPTGVVVNRDGIGDDRMDAFCKENELPILMRIPMERRFAEGTACGQTLVEVAPEYRPVFKDLLQKIAGMVRA